MWQCAYSYFNFWWLTSGSASRFHLAMFATPHFLEHVFLRKYMMFIDHTTFQILPLAWGTWTTTWFALTMFCLSFVMFSTMLWTSIGGLNPSIIDLPSSACVHKSIDPNGCQTFATCSHQTNKDGSCDADVFSSICLWWINIVNIPKVWEQLQAFLSTTLSTPFNGKSTSSFAI